MTANNKSTSGKSEAFDHVARLANSHFQIVDGELNVAGIPVSQLVAEYGSPLYVYNEDVIRKTVQSVQSILPPDFDLYYSIKANPNASLLKIMLDQNLGLEVASEGELFQALKAGCAAGHIIFAGPGKTEKDLVAAVDAGIGELHVESIDEAITLSRICESRSKQLDISLRINPTDAAGGAMRMGGRPSPFGIDEESLDESLSAISKLPHLNVVGVHLFMGTQILDADVLLQQYQRALALARQVASNLQTPLRSIDMGGGWGTPYFPKERVLDLGKVSTALQQIHHEIKHDDLLRQCRAIIEPGRFLVNEAGLYLSRVTRVKHSRGKVFVVIDGGMHHHLAASGNLGQTIKRNFPVAIATRMNHPNPILSEVVGPLCTPLDTLARAALLPPASEGDIFCVFQSGAYGRTSSPHHFLSHATPPEILVSDAKSTLIRRRGDNHDLYIDQILPVANP